MHTRFINKAIGLGLITILACSCGEDNELSSEATPSTETETTEEIMTRLIPLGLDGNMDEINALEDRVLRGKIKAAIVRAKRDKK